MTVHDIARALPDIATLRDRCRGLAMLDAILSPVWESRYYSYDSRWARGEEAASMRNGSGDEYSIVFTSAGAFIRGFDHESPMSPFHARPRQLWAGLLEGVPEVFEAQAGEQAFTFEGILSATFCLWRQHSDDRWHTRTIEFPGRRGFTDDPDGSARLLGILTDPGTQAYREFAADYFAVELGHDAVAHVLALRPLTDAIVAALNPEVTLLDVAKDAADVNYPAWL